jgi:hypothetical protein
MIRIKNIADGHNKKSLDEVVQQQMNKYAGLHSSLGCMPCNNHLYDLSNHFQSVPGQCVSESCFFVDFLLCQRLVVF